MDFHALSGTLNVDTHGMGKDAEKAIDISEVNIMDFLNKNQKSMGFTSKKKGENPEEVDGSEPRDHGSSSSAEEAEADTAAVAAALEDEGSYDEGGDDFCPGSDRPLLGHKSKDGTEGGASGQDKEDGKPHNERILILKEKRSMQQKNFYSKINAAKKKEKIKEAYKQKKEQSFQ